MRSEKAEVLIVGGGLAGLSAAIYLGRAKRDTLIIDQGRSMARWEPDVQNYLGFPDGIAGADLVCRARAQARRYGTRFLHDHIDWARVRNGHFSLRGQKRFYTGKRLLLCTGAFHVPPDLPDIEACLGQSLFFCKDCDGYRVQGKSVGIYGWTNEAIEYALGMLLYSPCVMVVTDGRKPAWDKRHQRWAREYDIPVYPSPIVALGRQQHRVRHFLFQNGTEVYVDAVFVTRGDIYFNEIARGLGAKVDPQGQILVDSDMRTSVKGLYAAGCVTPANCQMIIAAGQGATAAQAINRDLFEHSLATHNLRRFRCRQLRTRRTRPAGHRAPLARTRLAGKAAVEG